ncbi:hypothetical protein V8G54_026893 [Vigna mungo]|uniref:Uncharacterized protein n=1 Tax=Vigna mungo TaxID=3915 RepID=A0AAQ3N0W3_VIGMU
MIRSIHNFFSLVDITKQPCLGNKQKSQVCLCQFPQSIRRTTYSPFKHEFFLLLEFQNSLLDCVLDDKPHNSYRFVLPYSVNSVLSLALHGRVPPRVHKEDV